MDSTVNAVNPVNTFKEENPMDGTETSALHRPRAGGGRPQEINTAFIAIFVMDAYAGF
jgi:hypothetical protein